MKLLSRKKYLGILLCVVALCGVGSLVMYLTDVENPLQPAPSRERFPVAGIDISAHNGDSIDFEAVRADSVEFVLIKATEGADFKDRNFLRNLREARRAGLKVGAYHFYRFDRSGYTQALNFLNSVRGRELDLPLVIDIEEWTNPKEYQTGGILKNLDRMISHLTARGYRVMLYTNKDGYERFIRGRFDSYPVWISSFTEPDEDIEWDLWQHSHRGSVDGVDSKVDLNRFKGSYSEWEEWLGTVAQ